MARKDPAGQLGERLRALAEAVDLCEGRVDPEAVAEARRVVQQADRRLAISGDATVVALAGATGSGKSSMFNALTGGDLATVGIRRPTTSHAMAGVWGEDTAGELLDWLEVPRRHALGDARDGLSSLVLLDLPDHDSTERAHRTEVDRLVQLVDMLVWVVDPQKYADAALHDRYLKPLAAHAEVMMVLLNQADRLTPAQRESCLRDLRRLLDSEGLRSVDVLPVSATTGEGLDRFRKILSRHVADKQGAARRLAADLTRAGTRLQEANGTVEAPALSKAVVARLNRALARAAGVQVVTEAVGNAWRLRGGLATGWPALSWVAKFRPDPLRRLHLDRLRGSGRKAELEPTRQGRTALPALSAVPHAQVESALREVADDASRGLTRGWADAIRIAARSEHDRLPDELDRAVSGVDLDLDRHRGWWQAVRVVQWLLIAAVVAGLLWLGSAFVLAYLQLPPLPKVRWFGLPAPTVLVIGGVLAGLLLAAISRVGVEIGARRRMRRANGELTAAIGRATSRLVVAPVTAELDRYRRSTSALSSALRAR